MRQKLINALNQDFDNNEEYPFCWLDEEYKDKPKDENPGAFYWNKLFDQKNKGNSFLENWLFRIFVGQERKEKKVARVIEKE